ncbi:MAG TPA: helix-turn-helix domain-containing protein [Solirubrobacterales bacterium]|nr:helix-turn-helix domain-containing protein [Solirubrobacterales bacterium]
MPAGIGETLREARLAAGIDLDQAERTIRIRIRYLDALENEDWGVLPGEAYVRGFLHTYGDYLGVDGAALVEEYDRLGVQAEAEHPMEVPFEPPRPVGGNPIWRRAGTIALAVSAGLVALFLVLAITDGSDKKDGGRGHRGGNGGGKQTSTTTRSIPSEASVLLSPTGTVWVCLVDHSGKPLVNGETLTSGDDRGPFKDRDLKLTLGNGEMRIELNGEQVSIPSAANPVGFALTPQGATPLSSTARPTCS